MCVPLKPQSLHVDLHEHHESAYHSPVAWLLNSLGFGSPKMGRKKLEGKAVEVVMFVLGGCKVRI